MAIVQTNGTSAVTAQSTRNASGAMIQSGSNASGVIAKVNLGSHYGLGAFASTPVDGTDTNEANISGIYAYNNTSPIAKRYTTKLSGVSNTALLTGGNVKNLRRKVHKIESFTSRLQTTAIRAGKFSLYSGKFINNQTGEVEQPTVQNDTLWSPVNDAYGAQDDAATPTASVPGELTYLVGKIPVNDNYKVKTNY